MLAFLSACDGPDCWPPGAPVDLRYMHNGQNALFGEHAIIDRDEIVFSKLDKPGETDMWFVDSTMAIKLFLFTNTTYLVKLGDNRTDTIQMPDYLTPLGKDCSVTIAMDVLLNGEFICEFGCEKVVEISL